jgi:capsular exopolysaccharide synthesis family protein
MTEETRYPARAGNNGNRKLPSTELGGWIPEWDQEEVHLRDYLHVLSRRKWLIVSFLTLVFISTLILTLASPKIYRASAQLEVIPSTNKVTKFEEVTATDHRAYEYYQTQVELLKSPALARRVIDRIELSEYPLVAEQVLGKGEPGAVDRFKGWVRGLLSGIAGSGKKNVRPAGIAPEELEERSLISFFNGNLSVFPSRKWAMLVTISFDSPDRLLSRDVVNALVDEMIQWRMEKRLEDSKLAREFLMKQIDRAKIDLERAEEEMNRFAKQSGIISLDSKLNSVYRQLEELNSSLAEAEAELIGKQAAYRQAKEEGPSNLLQVMDSSLISQLKAEHARLRSEYEDQSVIFHDAYPAVKALKARMQSVGKRIEAEEKKIFLSIENDYQAALKRVENLQRRLEDQKQKAVELNERATQYKIMAREVETNKQIYQSLLERAKEVESMAGVSSSNIQIVDKALTPLLPYKPRVRRNLLLAIVVGLLGGIGLAFFVEYFNDSITDPEEIATRFNIPILGIAPLEKNGGRPIEKVFVADPRSPLAESLRTARVSIRLSGAKAHSKSILLTSTRPREGKSTLAANLSLAFYSAGEKVLLIDADLRNPRLHEIFDWETVRGSAGLSRYLAGISEENLVVCNGIKNLHLIPAGPVPPNPVELLASPRFRDLIASMQQRYDRIIIDAPPFLGFADILVMSQSVGGIVLVSSMGETTRAALRDFKKNIANCKGTILGCIVNKVHFSRGYGYRSYYKYYGSREIGRVDSDAGEFKQITG